MTCRRKTKSERELVADIRKGARLMCAKYHNINDKCYKCPLYKYQVSVIDDCGKAYAVYLLEKNK